MPFYQIVFHTRNVRANRASDPKGAYATRFIRAHSDVQAIELGKIRLKAEYEVAMGWLETECEADSVERIGFWRYVANAPGKGSTLYLNDH